MQRGGPHSLQDKLTYERNVLINENTQWTAFLIVKIEEW